MPGHAGDRRERARGNDGRDQCIYTANAAAPSGVYGPNPVGTKLPTQQGVYDRCGNVNEWLAASSPPSAPRFADDPYVSDGFEGIFHLGDFQGTEGPLDVKTREGTDDNDTTAGIRATRTLRGGESQRP